MNGSCNQFWSAESICDKASGEMVDCGTGGCGWDMVNSEGEGDEETIIERIDNDSLECRISCEGLFDRLFSE